MKKILIIIVIATFSCMAYAGMITKEPNGIFTVSTDYYKVSFFPRHMLPYEISISGEKFKPEFLDRLYDKSEKKEYFLSKDRYADIKVEKDDGETVMVKASGKYCQNNTVAAPGSTAAVYQYTIRKNSPFMDINCSVTKNDNREWSQLWIMQPAFKKNPFKTVATQKLDKEINLASVNKRTKFSAKDWGEFATDKAAIGIASPQGIMWYDMNKTFYTYLAGAMIRNWKSSTINLDCKLYLGPGHVRNSYAKVYGKIGSPTISSCNFNFTLKSGDYQVLMGPKCTTIRKIIYQGVELGGSNGWYGTIFATAHEKFIGAGHTQGGVEKVESVEVTCDGTRQNLKKDQSYSGNTVQFKKVSMLGNLRVYMVLSITSDGIKISKHFEAMADQKAFSLYIFQFCWTNKMTNYKAMLDNGKIEEGITTAANEKFLLNKPRIKYLAMFSKTLGKGIIESFDEIYDTQKQTIWDRKIYKKHYMMLKTPEMYKKGYKSPDYTINLKGFNSDSSDPKIML